MEHMDFLLDKFVQVFPMFQPSASEIEKREDRRAACGGGPRPPPEDVTVRIVFEEFSVTLWAWSSRGGLIVLQGATAVDFDFLGLERVIPRLRRHSSESAEDDLCRRLLLLGAKWWDSSSRYGFFRLLDELPSALADLEDEREPWLTLRERRWVTVGWPSDPRGGLWVAEFDTSLPGIEEEDNLVPDNATSVLLARDMDER